MKTLKKTFERLGLDDVRTYINSGNVLFAVGGSRRSIAKPTAEIERGDRRGLRPHRRCGVAIPRPVRAGRVVAAVPDDWTNGGAMKCDVMFLWDDFDRPSISEDIPHDAEIDDLVYVPGAVVRRVDRDKATKSPMTKIVGTASTEG